MLEKHYLYIHILHIIKEIRKLYELDYSDCCRIQRIRLCFLFGAKLV